MRTLIYKMTHSGDPDPETGEWGCNNCMGPVRAWGFDAVIGIGGTGPGPVREGISHKLTWIGMGKHETIIDPSRPRCQLVTFDHFVPYEEQGPLLRNIAPRLASRMYKKNAPRHIMDSLSFEEQREIEQILDLARDAPPSFQLNGRDSRHTRRKCRPLSRDLCSTDDCRPSKRRRIRVSCNRKPK